MKPFSNLPLLSKFFTEKERSFSQNCQSTDYLWLNVTFMFRCCRRRTTTLRPDKYERDSKDITYTFTKVNMRLKRLFINTLRPRQHGRLFADDTFKRIFLNGNDRISIKISLKFVPGSPIDNSPTLVQIMAWRRPGDKLLSEPMMVTLPTHVCVTRPQWVNGVLLTSQQYIFYWYKHMICVELLNLVIHCIIWCFIPSKENVTCQNCGLLKAKF